MMISRSRFNIYLASILALLVLLGAGVGCKTSKSESKKIVSVLRLHLESTRRDDSTEVVSVFRSNPVQFRVEKNPFLSEGLLEQARIVEQTGGFGLELTFERRGAWLLEQYTAAGIGKRAAIYTEFVPNPAEPKILEKRWLAAPKITKRITDGVFTFTPDASREECERILVGVTNLVRQVK
jgi:hypothetical protein